MTGHKSCVDLIHYGPEAPSYRPVSLGESNTYCRQLARSHYENFTVASYLMPTDLRQHFYNIYAYCRWADDLADELADPNESLQMLDWWEEQLESRYAGRATHPVFVALGPTIESFEIPIEPFRQLLRAFRRDQRQTRYETLDDLLSYCECSANPAGRIVLHLARSHNAENAILSDLICTGLQLANFCQDVGRDYVRGRIYLPLESCREFGYSEADFDARVYNASFRYLLESEVDRAEAYLRAGVPLVDRVPSPFRVDIELFVRGGLAVLDAIRRAEYNVWRKRPTIGKWKKTQLLIGVWWRALVR